MLNGNPPTSVASEVDDGDILDEPRDDDDAADDSHAEDEDGPDGCDDDTDDDALTKADVAEDGSEDADDSDGLEDQPHECKSVGPMPSSTWSDTFAHCRFRLILEVRGTSDQGPVIELSLTFYGWDGPKGRRAAKLDPGQIPGNRN